MTQWMKVLAAVATCGLIVGCQGSNEGTTASEDADLKAVDINAGGPASLRIPIVEYVKKGHSYKTQLVATRNAQWTAAGLQAIPEFVTVDENTQAKPFTDVAERIENESERAIGADTSLELVQYSDGSALEGGFGRGKQGLCYTGSPKRAVELITSLTDAVFSDQFSLWAWKYKKLAFDGYGEPFADSEEAEYEADSYPDVWKEWRGQGDAILLISSTSDGGEERNPTIVRKCK